MARTGGENLQQEFNRGFDYIVNTYSAAENTLPGKDSAPMLSKGVVIDIDFDTQKNYKLAAGQPPFSIYAKIIGEDLDVDDPRLEVEKIYYAPLFSIHNISVPEIGEEILIMRESMSPSSKGYYIGRISNCSTLGYYPVRQYMDTINSENNSPEFKYGFSFNAQQLREDKNDLMPSDQIESISIPMTYGDVVQQGRSQSYVRHSFNRNNKKGVFEQGLRFQQQNISTNITNTIKGINGMSYDPSIGQSATKTVHFVDLSIKRLGDYNLASVFSDKPFQGTLDGTTADDKSIIANLADEIYNISTQENNPTLYRQVLGEKLISHQRKTNNLMRTMLDGLTGLTETVQVLLDAFIEHEHALPKIELNLEKTITASDRYVQPAKYRQQPPQEIRVPSRIVRVRTGYDTRRRRAIYSYVNVPGFSRTVERPPKLVQHARTRVRRKTHKINFEAIIGGKENPRFTAPIQTDTASPDVVPLPGSPVQNIEKTGLGMKTAQINTDTEGLIKKFNNQKEQLSNIFNKTTDFLSKNQFIN